MEGDSEDSAGFVITRSADPAIISGSATDTRYVIAVDFVLGGDAVRGTDYVVMSGESVITSDTISIPEGQTAVGLSIKPINDAVKEDDMPVTLTITSASSSGVEDPAGCCCANWGPGGPFPVDENADTGTVTILDDDWWKVGITAPEDDQLVREPGEGQPEQPDQTTTLTVTRSPSKTVTYEMDKSYSMKVYLDLGTLAVNAACPGIDYELSQGFIPLSYWSDPSVTISAGATERLLTFTAIGDAIPEIEEVAPITVLPDASPNGTTYTRDDDATQVTVSLQDNDWTVSIASGDSDASEDSDEVTGEPLDPGQFQIIRVGSGPADHDLVVKFTIPQSLAYADAHPQDHWDYSLAVDEAVHGTGSSAAVSIAWNSETSSYEGTATIPTGSHTLAIKLMPNDDEYLELEEEVTYLSIFGGRPGGSRVGVLKVVAHWA